MDINWQEFYYVIASITAVLVIVVFAWFLRILFSISKLLSTLAHSAQRLGNGIDGIKGLGKNITRGILRKIVNILEKGDKDE